MEMKLTFLSAGELRSLPTDLCFEAVWQSADELEDVGIGTSLLDLLLRNFLDGLGSTEEHVKLDCSVVQSWFLRY